jgi:hypothetical protein
VKVVSETGEKRKIFFCKIVVTSVSVKQNFQTEEMLSSYLNERWQFGYAVK